MKSEELKCYTKNICKIYFNIIKNLLTSIHQYKTGDVDPVSKSNIRIIVHSNSEPKIPPIPSWLLAVDSKHSSYTIVAACMLIQNIPPISWWLLAVDSKHSFNTIVMLVYSKLSSKTIVADCCWFKTFLQYHPGCLFIQNIPPKPSWRLVVDSKHSSKTIVVTSLTC